MVKSITEYGKLRANPEALTANMLKLSDECACAGVSACKDTLTATVASPRTVVAVKHNGVVFPTSAPIVTPGGETISPAVGPLQPGNIKAWLQKVLSVYEFDLNVEVTYATNVLTVTHIGQGRLSEIHLDNGTIIAVSTCCEVVQANKWQLSVVGDPGEVGFNGSTEVLANVPYAWAGTSADVATAAELQADLVAAFVDLGYDNVSVEVSVDNALEAFTVVVYSPMSPFTVGLQAATYCGVQEFFAC